ncbi:ABC transporter substrate binding protein [Rickettsia endosymbiont of Gonocerus acuteangulatus]|uniref:ABC transporter substrate binding protein n=1 Tax=Rickettsia endosymbiont of Gonocerus acuteangulatus TaxID=3066266 RepID=UPI0031334391
MSFLNIFLRVFSLLFSLFFTLSVYATQKNVAVIVPLEHEAMTQIVAGIEESLKAIDAKIIMKNAHADSNILLAIIKQIKDQDIDVIIPIGTSACQTVISHVSDKPIVCAAAKIDNRNLPLVTGVNDEIKITDIINKLPFLQNITLIYSSSEKVIPEVEEMERYVKKNNISLNLKMVQNLNDLSVAVKNAPENTQCFVILKDHLIVSGINILKQEAFKRDIPIIASDEGSVISGATIAVGVREKDIGFKVGNQAKQILESIAPKDIPFQNMYELTLFVNLKSFIKQKILTKENLANFPFNRKELEE